MTDSAGDASERARVGLCADCRHAAVQRSARGSAFWRCLRSDGDPRFTRYPPLPVQQCHGFEPDPERSRQDTTS